MPKIRRGPIGLRTRVERDAIGQPIVVSDGIFGVVGRWLVGLWRSSSALRTAVIAGAVSAAVSAWMADENNIAGAGKTNEAHAGKLLCEVSPHNGKFFICQVLVGGQENGIARANNRAAGDADANEQLSLDGASK